MSSTTTTIDFRTILHRKGYKATPARVALLTTLSAAAKPLSVEDIIEKLKTSAPDIATVYRAVKEMKKSGLIRQVDLQHSHAHYELVDAKDHHHFVCTQCGRVVDFKGCNLENMIATALKNTPGFAKVTEHSLELFGLCAQCAKKN